MDIINLLEIDNRITTSGQPENSDFEEIAARGFKTVINLALPTSDNAIPEEGAIVTSLGMNYIHIPVVWEAPQVEQFQLFSALLETLPDDRIWVHCAMNMRVSCFMYLHNRRTAAMPEHQARSLMNQVWEPDETWTGFMEEIEDSLDLDMTILPPE
jgi:uncharacterized protein (TIGR01244 family)